MGVLNVTPDSFSDGGQYGDPDRAFTRALELEDEGADILDIGAESTRPGSARVSEAEELRRLVPVLKRLKEKLRIPISVDTYKAAVAEKALEHGAEIINDSSGLALDPRLPKVISKWDAGLIINHMRGTPETWLKLPPLKDVMRTIHGELEAPPIARCIAGIQKQQIAIDPGIGFGKRREQNAEIIAKLSTLARLICPSLLDLLESIFSSRTTRLEPSSHSRRGGGMRIQRSANCASARRQGHEGSARSGGQHSPQQRRRVDRALAAFPLAILAPEARVRKLPPFFSRMRQRRLREMPLIGGFVG